MYIRELYVDELDLCEPFGKAFHAEKIIPDEFSLTEFISNWENFYRQGIGVIFGLFDEEDVLIGGIGGILAKDLTSGTLAMNELFWYVQKDKRHSTGRWPLRLVQRLAVWGSLRRAKQLRMVHLLTKGENYKDQQIAEIYTKILHLKPIEVAFLGPIGV